MRTIRLTALGILIAGGLLGYFVYTSEVDPNSRFPFQLGLDLAGGTHLVYNADVSELPPEEVSESMQALRDVIERRVNTFGVTEPVVQVSQSSFVAEEQQPRLLIELPGVTDTQEAIEQIGETPTLAFALVKSGTSSPAIGSSAETMASSLDRTELTGRFLQDARLEFQGQTQNEPVVALQFNGEGAELFESITRENTGEVLAVMLDGQIIQTPVIREAIPGGQAIISGNFAPEEARELARNLSLGALPIPIELATVETIGASLGGEALSAGVIAGMLGIAAVAFFMLLWYRLPGLVAVTSLAFYIAAMLAVFKVIPVTLTAAGLAGFILSIGMAVDANVLIFERLKEERRAGRGLREAIREGFARAWPAIRDGNLTSLFIAVILFWFGTSLIEGFALVFGIGVMLSMASAVTVSRTFLLTLSSEAPMASPQGRVLRVLFGSGIEK